MNINYKNMTNLFGDKIEFKNMLKPRISKTSKFFKMYFKSIFDEEQRKMIYTSFKTSNYFKITDLNNYIEITKFENKINHNLEFVKRYINELKDIKIGDVNWYEKISNSFIVYLNDLAYSKYYDDMNNFAYKNENNDKMYDFLEEKINDVELFLESNFDTYYIDKKGVMSDECLEKILMGKRIQIKAKLYSKVLYNSIIDDVYENLDLNEKGDLILSDFAYKKYVLDEETIFLTKKEKIYSSVKRTYRNFKNIIQCNGEKFNQFVTLTFAMIDNKEKHLKMNNNDEYDLKFKYVSDSKDYEICVKTMTNFLDKMKKTLKRRNIEFYYLGVPEYHKDGRIHYHFLMSDIPNELKYKIPTWLDLNTSMKNKGIIFRNNHYGLINWTCGKSVIEDIKDNARVGTYISKYMVKSLENIDETSYTDRLNKKRYYVSRNIEKLSVSYSNSVDEFDYFSKYENEIVSAYNDSKITKTLYQVKELNKKEVFV